MRDVWHTAAEWAAMELPGLPGTEQNIRARALRGAWEARGKEGGRGGGSEYPLRALPDAARAEYARRQIAVIDVPLSVAQMAAEEPQADRIEPSAAGQRDARLAVLVALDRFAQEAGIPLRRADELFCAAYAAGTVPVADWVRAAVKRVTPRTLFRWRAARKAGATHRLAVDRGAARRERGVLDIANDGAVRDTLLATMAKFPHLGAEALRDFIADRFGKVLVIGDKCAPLPSLRTFQTALKVFRERYESELLAITNPDAFKSHRRVSGRLAHLVSRVNELWQIDASPADVLTKDGRYSIYVLIDVFSRRVIILVTKTPRAAAVGLLIRRGILEWGVPERVKTDNGSDFVAHYIQRVFASLGIEVEVAPPFSPEKKGVVERNIRTVQHGLMEMLPGYVGHSVADRKAIEGRKAFSQRLGRSDESAFEVDLTPAELQRYCDDWAAHVYATRPHGGLSGATPFQVAASCPTTKRTVDVRALDFLLAPVAGKDGKRTVGKQGVPIDRTMYMPVGVLPGTEVLVRHDPADLGRVMLFARDGETYLGEAIAPELAGIDPAELVQRARAAQEEQRRAFAAQTKRIKIKPRDVVDASIRAGRERSAALIAFPKREEQHETPAIAAALDAATPAVPAPIAPSVIELQRQLLAEENITPIRRTETAHDRWKRALVIAERMTSGLPVAPADALWLGGYREGSEFKGFALTYGDPLEKENPAEAGI